MSLCAHWEEIFWGMCPSIDFLGPGLLHLSKKVPMAPQGGCANGSPNSSVRGFSLFHVFSSTWWCQIFKNAF